MMKLENIVRKTSYGLAGFALAANLYCSPSQGAKVDSKDYSQPSSASYELPNLPSLDEVSKSDESYKIFRETLLNSGVESQYIPSREELSNYLQDSEVREMLKESDDYVANFVKEWEKKNCDPKKDY